MGKVNKICESQILHYFFPFVSINVREPLLTEMDRTRPGRVFASQQLCISNHFVAFHQTNFSI